MNRLIIRHLPESDPAQFEVVREDGKHTDPCTVTPPHGFPVEGRPKSSLSLELRWYLEDFLEYPFEPHTDVAERIMDALREWGKRAFDDLFDNRVAGVILDRAKGKGYKNLNIQVMSDDPRILQWPWEALQDPQATYLAISGPIERRLNSVPDPLPISSDLPRDRINILLITARPYEGDVHYRSISRPLVELIEQEDIPTNVHVLRPPTFKNLHHHLEERPNHYHLIHFDGHGGYGQMKAGAGRRHMYAGREEGVLVFEDDKGKEDQISAEQLAGLLQEHPVPLMVMNACRSGMLGGMAQDPFASVAASLLKSGIRGVVAMAYSLYVSGAQVFLPEFYSELFKSGSLSRAIWKGRQAMFGDRKRICSRGRFDLNDFIVPVIYQQEPYQLSFLDEAEAVRKTEKAELPEEARDEQNPYGFIGRDRELLRLERAMRTETPAILISGIGGVGKTTLARGFLKWLFNTEGMDGCLWLTFIDIRSAEYVINVMGYAFYGKDFLVLDIETKINAITKAVRKARIIFVWDNFEVTAGIPGSNITANLSEDDRNLLLRLLERMRGGSGKVLITSRSDEEWLGVQRLKVSIGGLAGEERWEFCDKILDNLGLEINRDDPEFAKLMDSLNGHPLMMRVILPRLEKMTARQVIDALGPEAGDLFAVLKFVEKGLDEDLRPLLIPLAFHELYTDADILEEVSQQIDETLTREKIDLFLKALVAAGLLRNISCPLYEIHPAFTAHIKNETYKLYDDTAINVWIIRLIQIYCINVALISKQPLFIRRHFLHYHRTTINILLNYASELSLHKECIILADSIAEFDLLVGDLVDALNQYLAILSVAEATNNVIAKSITCHQIALAYYKFGLFSKARLWYLRTLVLDMKSGDCIRIASTYRSIGIIYQDTVNYELAKSYYCTSLDICTDNNDYNGMAITHHQLGILYRLLNNLNKAYYHLKIAIEMKEIHNDLPSCAFTYYELAYVELLRGNADEAYSFCNKSLNIRIKYGDSEGVAQAYNLMAAIKIKNGEYGEAKNILLHVLEYGEKKANIKTIAESCTGLAEIAMKEEDYKTAVEWEKKAYKAIESSEYDKYKIRISIRIGTMSLMNGSTEDAKKWFNKTLEMSVEKCDICDEAELYMGLGSCMGLGSKYVEAAKNIVNAIKGYEKTKHREIIDILRKIYVLTYEQATREEKKEIMEIWKMANMGKL